MSSNGRVQVDNVKTCVELASAYGVCNQRLKLKCDEPISNVWVFNLQLRRYCEEETAMRRRKPSRGGRSRGPGVAREVRGGGRGAAAPAVTVMVTGCCSVTPKPTSQRGVSAASDRPTSACCITGVPQGTAVQVDLRLTTC